MTLSAPHTTVVMPQKLQSGQGTAALQKVLLFLKEPRWCWQALGHSHIILYVTHLHERGSNKQ